MTAQARQVNPWLIAIMVSLATFIEVLDTTITNVALPHMAGSLAASQDESTWVLTSYLVSNGIILPLSGWLAQAIGRKRFFLICIAGFTLASLACGFADSLSSLIVFRLIQGLAGGGLQPTQQAIVLDAFPPHKRGAVFAITGITVVAAPVIGPTLGGWITDHFSWRWVFFINIPFGLLTFYAVQKLVEDPVHAVARGFGKIDTLSLSLVALGLAALQIVLDKGQQDDWLNSPFIVGMGVFCVLSLLWACLRLWEDPDGLIAIRLLEKRGFGVPCILIFLTGFVLYGSSMLLPLLAQSMLGYDATLAGLVLSPGGIAVMFLMPVAGKLVSHVQARYLIAFGLLMSVIGFAYTAQLSPQIDYSTLVWMRIVSMVSLPFLFVPASTLAFSVVPVEMNNKASALFSLMRNLGGSFGIALSSTLLTRYQQAHQSHLASALSAYHPEDYAALKSMAAALHAHGLPLVEASGKAMAGLYQMMMRQSVFLAYGDTFQFLAILSAAALAITLFLPANTPHKGQGGGMGH